MSDIQKQIELAEKETGKKIDKKIDIGMVNGGIMIDDVLYELEEPVVKLIVGAIVSNQHLVNQVQQLKDYIARSEIGREIMS